MEWIKDFKVGDKVIVSSKKDVTPEDVQNFSNLVFTFDVITKICSDYVLTERHKQAKFTIRKDSGAIGYKHVYGGFLERKTTEYYYLIKPTPELIEAGENKISDWEVGIVLEKIARRRWNKVNFDELKKFADSL